MASSKISINCCSTRRYSLFIGVIYSCPFLIIINVETCRAAAYSSVPALYSVSSNIEQFSLPLILFIHLLWRHISLFNQFLIITSKSIYVITLHSPSIWMNECNVIFNLMICCGSLLPQRKPHSYHSVFSIYFWLDATADACMECVSVCVQRSRQYLRFIVFVHNFNSFYLIEHIFVILSFLYRQLLAQTEGLQLK